MLKTAPFDCAINEKCFRAYLHGVGGPQVGEVTCLGWVTCLFI